MISPSQRSQPDNTHPSQQTDIHASGGIRTHNLSTQSATESRLRPRGHWDITCCSAQINELALNYIIRLEKMCTLHYVLTASITIIIDVSEGKKTSRGLRSTSCLILYKICVKRIRYLIKLSRLARNLFVGPGLLFLATCLTTLLTKPVPRYQNSQSGITTCGHKPLR